MTFKKSCKAIIPIVFLALNSTTVFAESGGGLIEKMSRMQYFLHKAGLSLEAENLELARFYVHELEETVEALEKFGTYKGYPIGNLAKSKLSPGIEMLEDSVKAGHLQKAWPAFEGLVSSCNNCHQATNHSFIAIQYDKNAPFMQTFKPLQ